MIGIPKPSRTARKLAEHKRRLERETHEETEKRAVRRRDKRCRFPLCGCHRLGLRLEVSHDVHKGAGGNPTGDRSDRRSMILLCVHRHQDGLVSRHKGTLRILPLVRGLGFEGPVRFMWNTIELARESAPGVLEPLTEEQRARLLILAGMHQ